MRPTPRCWAAELRLGPTGGDREVLGFGPCGRAGPRCLLLREQVPGAHGFFRETGRGAPRFGEPPVGPSPQRPGASARGVAEAFGFSAVGCTSVGLAKAGGCMGLAASAGGSVQTAWRACSGVPNDDALGRGLRSATGSAVTLSVWVGKPKGATSCSSWQHGEMQRLLRWSKAPRSSARGKRTGSPWRHGWNGRGRRG